jgi:hypoxanthine phosphoribosyltransferase
VTRIFEHRRLWRVTPEAYRAATRLLAKAVLNRLDAVPLIIGVGEGGRAPAYAIGEEIGASTIIVTAKHNASDETGLEATGEVVCDLTPLRTFECNRPLPGPFLIVDDICGSGFTLATIIATLRPLTDQGSPICTVTLCRNAGAPDGLPDLYVWDVADWVVFPWERHSSGCTADLLPVPKEVRAT